MNTESFLLFIHCFVTLMLCRIASLNKLPSGQLNSYYIQLEFSFTSEVIYAQTVSQKISRYDPKMTPTTRFVFQVIRHAFKIGLFLIIIPSSSSKETAQASLKLWMIHPNRTDETQRQAVK